MGTVRPERTSSVPEELIPPSDKSVSCGQAKSFSIDFERHKLLAYSIWNKYSSKFPWLRQDIEQEVLLALWEATQKFDAAHGTKFSTFAFRNIHGRVLYFIKTEMRHVEARKPPYAASKLTAAIQEQPIPEQDQLLSDFDLLKEHERGTTRKFLESALAYLTEKELDVIRLLYWGDLTATDVAQTIGVSNARVSMLAANSRKRLRPILQTVQ